MHDRVYKVKYEYEPNFGIGRHTWSVCGARIGAHLHISDIGEERGREYGRYSGGIEIHYRTPPEYMKNDAPTSINCWLIGGPCWHDGSSMQATEKWIPMWLRNTNDHAVIFRELKRVIEEIDIEQQTLRAGGEVSA